MVSLKIVTQIAGRMRSRLYHFHETLLNCKKIEIILKKATKNLGGIKTSDQMKMITGLVAIGKLHCVIHSQELNKYYLGY